MQLNAWDHAYYSKGVNLDFLDISLFHNTCIILVESKKTQDGVLTFLVLNLTGQRFALREGGRTVGAGVVSKVLS